jgi:hypothetical protein
MFDPNAPSSSSSSGGGASGPNARYAYLVGRLRGRQITMEEATELFGIQQAMLQRSEAGRQALMAASRNRGMAGGATTLTTSPTPTPTVVVGGSDDMLLFGLLAMGAGAGLVAALAKRIQDGTLPTPPPPSKSSGSSR